MYVTTVSKTIFGYRTRTQTNTYTESSAAGAQRLDKQLARVCKNKSAAVYLVQRRIQHLQPQPPSGMGQELQ